ncbi:MAG: MMPL family transporter, partial [Chrysiogenetes bacterium]|nr:MMPL family transporter [Chrysiogenetes bacterium]
MIKRFARFVIDQRVFILALNLVMFAFFAWKALDIGFVMTPEIWFRPTDPARVAYDQLHEYFGDDEFVIAVIEDKENGVFNNHALAAIERLTREMEEAPYINKVQSLTEFEWIHGEENSLIVDGLLRDAIDDNDFPLAQEDIDHAKRVILGDPGKNIPGDELAISLLTNPEGTSAAVIGRVERVSDTFDHKVELSRHMFKVFDKEEATSGYYVYYAGSPFIDYAFFEYSLQDNQRLMPALYGLIILVLFLVIRRWTGVVYPLLVVAVTTVAVVGMIVTIGSAIQTMTAMLPMLLIAVCIADSIHIVVDYYERLHEIGDRKEAAVVTIEDMFMPCFLTSLTTCIGFASITMSDMPPVNEYGTLAAFGVALAFLVSVTLLPALLSYGKVPRDIADPSKPHHLHPDEAGYRDRTLVTLQAMDRFVRARPKAILACTFALLGVAIWGITMLKTETVAIEFFQGSSPIRQNTYAIEDQLGAVANLEVVLGSGEEDGVKDPDFMLKMRKIEDYLETIPEVSKTISVVDFVERLNKSLHAERPEFDRVPVQADFEPGG